MEVNKKHKVLRYWVCYGVESKVVTRNEVNIERKRKYARL